MISIIISSYKLSFFQQVEQSVKETIGVNYEIIKIENPGLYSITQAYNMGAIKAQYNTLCFIHEDIKFHTNNWGLNLLQHFKNDADLGLIGIAGATEKLMLPSGWGHHYDEFNRINILQHTKHSEFFTLSSYKNNVSDYVKVLDGVFMATKKEVWQQFNFDEQLTGFHLYDIDFSLRVAQRYKVAVIYDVLIEHFSPGNFSDDWIKATINYYDDKNKQPLFDKYKGGKPIMRWPYYHFLLGMNISFKYRLKYALKLGFDKQSFFIIYRFLFPVTGTFLFKLLRKDQKENAKY